MTMACPISPFQEGPKLFLIGYGLMGTGGIDAVDTMICLIECSLEISSGLFGIDDHVLKETLCRHNLTDD